MKVLQRRLQREFVEVILLGKIKIHEIAKKLNLNSKDVLDKAKELGINAKTHLSGIEENEATKLEEAFSNKSEKKEKGNLQIQ